MPPPEWLMRRSMKKVFESSQQFPFPFSLSTPDMKFQIRSSRKEERRDGGGVNTTAHSFTPTDASYLWALHLNSELEFDLGPKTLLGTTMHMREERREGRKVLPANCSRK